MSEKIKYTQKELKQPDKFRSFIINLVDKATDNFNKLLYAFGSLVVILIIIYIFTSYQNKQSELAGTQFEQALALYNLGNTQEALTGFADLVSEYPNQQSSKLALYYSGNIYYDAGQYEESIEEMLKYLNSSPKNLLLEDSANLTIGLSYYNLENWEDAVSYLSMIQDSGSPYERQAKINLGLAYEKLGQYDKAQEIYKNVLSENISPAVNIQDLPN